MPPGQFIQHLLLATLCCAAHTPPVFSQDSLSGSQWQLFPDQLVFRPLLTNPQEPRLGLRKEVGNSRMRLDIGMALDLLEFTPSPGDRLRLGVTMFTYALTTSRQGLRLQVDAADGFFGGYIAYGSSMLAGRLRVLHHSAHFVDGHIDPSTEFWINGSAPVPYTRDFGEFLIAIEWRLARNFVSLYNGAAYATLVRPSEVQRFSTLHGIEWHNDNFPGTLLGKPVNCYASYNLTFSGIPHYVGTSTLEAGIKLGHWLNGGIRVFVGYHNGLEVFGQYFQMRDEIWNLGLVFDVW